MSDESESGFDRDLERSMALFRSARVGSVSRIEPRRPRKVLVALDGSGQDVTSLAFARYFLENMQAVIMITDARTLVDGQDLAGRAAGGLDAQVLPRHQGESFAQILECIARNGPDLVMMPSPFGEDFSLVGPDSTGAVVDVLLSRCPVPLLVVRDRLHSGFVDLSHVALVLSGRQDPISLAGAWATGMLAKSGRLHLNVDVDREELEALAALVKDVDPRANVTEEALEHALGKRYTRIHLALQSACEEQGQACEISVQRDVFTWLQDRACDEGHGLVVVPLDRDLHMSVGRTREIIRRSNLAVLAVPTHTTS